MAHPNDPARLSRRRFLAAGLALTATGLASGAMGSGLQQAHHPVTHHDTLPLPTLRAPLRIAFLTDLHYGPWIHARDVASWIEDALTPQPDLILLGGDLIDRHATQADLPELLDVLAALQAPLGTYAVWGNHDHAALPTPALRRFGQDLAHVGIDLLENHGLALRPDLFLAGVDDLVNGTPDLAAALWDAPEGVTTLLLAHNPDLLPQIAHHDVDLTLAGHTHGGQVVLPLVGPPFTSSTHGRRFLAGWIANPTRAYVSRGLGVSYLPLRWNCPPELLILDLHPTR